MQHIDLANKKILITGAAGFIGSYLVQELLRTVTPVTVIGIDNMNDYYDVSIKEYRLKEIKKQTAAHPESSWVFVKADISDKSVVDVLFQIYKPEIVVNLAAQAGVRYSIPIRMCISALTWTGSIIYWKLAAIPMITEPKAWNIWYTLLPLLYMVVIRRFHSQQKIRWIIR